MKLGSIFGFITAGYWSLAFYSGWCGLGVRDHSELPWWNVAFFRDPGLVVGSRIYSALEVTYTQDYQVLIGWPIIAALSGAVLVLGMFAFLIGYLISVRLVLRRTHVT